MGDETPFWLKRGNSPLEGGPTLEEERAKTTACGDPPSDAPSVWADIASTHPTNLLTDRAPAPFSKWDNTPPGGGGGVHNRPAPAPPRNPTLFLGTENKRAGNFHIKREYARRIIADGEELVAQASAAMGNRQFTRSRIWHLTTHAAKTFYQMPKAHNSGYSLQQWPEMVPGYWEQFEQYRDQHEVARERRSRIKARTVYSSWEITRAEIIRRLWNPELYDDICTQPVAVTRLCWKYAVSSKGFNPAEHGIKNATFYRRRRVICNRLWQIVLWNATS